MIKKVDDLLALMVGQLFVHDLRQGLADQFPNRPCQEASRHQTCQGVGSKEAQLGGKRDGDERPSLGNHIAEIVGAVALDN